MLEETEELLVAVPVLAEPGHLPGGDFQGGEQGGGAMADVVVAALLVVARLHRKHFLGAVQRLDLGLLIDAQHDRVSRRVQIQAYNVGDLGLQFRVDGERERVNLPRPDPVLLPGLGDRVLGAPPGGRAATRSSPAALPPAVAMLERTTFSSIAWSPSRSSRAGAGLFAMPHYPAKP